MIKPLMVQQYTLYIEPWALCLSVYPPYDIISNLNARKPNLNQNPSIDLVKFPKWKFD